MTEHGNGYVGTKRTLIGKIGVAFIGMVLFFMIVSFGFVFTVSKESSVNNIETNLNTSTGLTLKLVDETMLSVKNLAASITENTNLSRVLFAPTQETKDEAYSAFQYNMKLKILNYKDISEMKVVLIDGTVLGEPLPSGELKKPLAESWFSKIISTKDEYILFNNYELNLFEQDENNLIMGFPVSVNGANNAVALVKVNYTSLQEIIAGIKVAQTDQTYLVDCSGTFITKDFVSREDGEKILSKIGSKEDFRTTTVEKEKLILKVKPSLDERWLAVTTITNKEAVGPALNIATRMLVVCVFLLLISLIVFWFMQKQLVSGVQNILKFSEHVTSGDLTKTPDNAKTKELQLMLNTLINIKEQIRKVFINNRSVALEIETSSSVLKEQVADLSSMGKGVSESITSISESSSFQASELEKANLSISDLNSNLDKLLAKLTYLNGEFTKVVSNAEQGSAIVAELKATNSETNTSTDNALSKIKNLNDKIADIDEIMENLNYISSETQLLALNAHIEAAHAGEFGRGFNVIAKEIKKLADESKASTVRTQGIVSIIKSESVESIKFMEHVLKSLEVENQSVQGTFGAFTDIKSTALDFNDKLLEINQFISQIVDSKNVVVDTITSLAAVAEENAATSEEVNGFVQEELASIEVISEEVVHLKSLSDKLTDEISKFKID